MQMSNFCEGKWHLVPLRAGLNRCRKSCRLRWLNYLKPNIKRGAFSSDEVDLMLRLHRWSLIAGRLPGRTANDVKNYWNTNMEKKTTYPREARFKTQKNKVTEIINIIKPQPRAFSKVFPWLKTNTNTTTVPTMDNVTTVPTEVFTIIKSQPQIAPLPLSLPPPEDRNIDEDVQDQVPWWDDIFVDMEMNNSSTWQSFDELLLGNSLTTPRIEPAEDNTFLDIQTRDWVDSGIDDYLDIWGLLGND